MKLSMFTNSQPTVSAILSALASFVLFASVLDFVTFPKWALALALFAQAGGTAALGITAKQYNVTGGSIVQPGIPVAPVPPVPPVIILPVSVGS